MRVLNTELPISGVQAQGSHGRNDTDAKPSYKRPMQTGISSPKYGKLDIGWKWNRGVQRMLEIRSRYGFNELVTVANGSSRLA